MSVGVDRWNPEAVLDHVRRGDLTDDELEQYTSLALTRIAGIEALNRAEAAGAVTSGPTAALQSMRARRDADVRAWRQVAELAGGGPQR